MDYYLVYLNTVNIYNNSSKIFNFWITRAFVQFSFIKMWSLKTLMGIYEYNVCRLCFGWKCCLEYVHKLWVIIYWKWRKIMFLIIFLNCSINVKIYCILNSVEYVWLSVQRVQINLTCGKRSRLNSRCCGKNCGRRYSYFCDMIDICMCHPSCLVSGGPGYRDKDWYY